MNKLHFLFAIIFMIGFISCSDDDDGNTLEPVVSDQVNNLHAAQSADYTTSPPTITGDYVKFSFQEGGTVSGDNWDIAFSGTTVLVNGGEQSNTDQPARTGNAAAYITDGTFADIQSINNDLFSQDATSGLAIPTGSGNGWYTYTGPPSHLIVPTPGKIIVVRTHDNKFAKVEILSYYKDAPANPTGTEESQYYTFNYVFQPNENSTTF